MNLNFIISLSFTIVSCITIHRIIAFTKSNKLKRVRLIWSCVAVLSLYCLSLALQIVSETAVLMQVMFSINTIALSVLPGFFLLILNVFSTFGKKFKPAAVIALFIIPALNIFVILTSHYHNLFIYDCSITDIWGFIYMTYKKGVWFYVLSVYFATVMAISSVFIYIWYVKYRKRLFNILLISVTASAMLLVTLNAILNDDLYLLAVSFFPPLFSVFMSSQFISCELTSTLPFAHQKAFEHSDNAILIFDNEFRLIKYNDKAEAQVPELSKKMLNAKIETFLDFDGSIRESAILGDECHIQIESEDLTCHYKVLSSLIYDEKQNLTGYIVSLVDITALVSTMTELSRIAAIDTLTSAYTRGYFVQRATTEITRAKRHLKPLSLILLDLDYFKSVNDNYGHLAGDYVLKEVSLICKKSLRAIDILGRFGGEEFMILLPETDIKSAINAAERIRKTIEEAEFRYESQIIKTTASVGVTGVEFITVEDFDTLIKHADRALYEAKNGGRNQVKLCKCVIEEAII